MSKEEPPRKQRTTKPVRVCTTQDSLIEKCRPTPAGPHTPKVMYSFTNVREK